MDAHDARRFRTSGIITLGAGLLLSGLGIGVTVSLLPFGILVLLLGVVLVVMSAVGEVGA